MSSPENAIILTQRSSRRHQLRPGEPPVPLVPICGVTLIKRQIDALSRAGIKSCVVVLDEHGEAIRQAVQKDTSIKLPIHWIAPETTDKDEGQWLLKAKNHLSDPFILLKADHLFEAQAIQEFVQQARPDDHDVIMAVDRNLDSVFDIRVANKVKLTDGQIKNWGPKLKDFDAVDTGLYSCSSHFFSALENVQKNGKCKLSDGFNSLIEEKKLQYFDIQKSWWFDLDRPGEVDRAEKTLFDKLRKPTDGFISRNINRPLSLGLSRLLVKTPVTGNHVTFFSLILGMVSAGLFAMGSYGSVLLGAFLFQILSILDGCDGELAKIKLHDSKKGQLLDTIIDHITYVLFFIGVTLGYYNNHPEPYVLIIGLLTLTNVAIGVTIVSQYSKKMGNYSFVAANQSFFPKGEVAKRQTVSHWISWILSNIKFAVRRDFFAFVTLVVALCNGLAVIFWVAFAGSLLYAFGTLYGKSRYVPNA